MAGLNPDGWINYLYVQDAINQGLRGFAFSRMGSGYEGYANDAYTVPGGPWSNHRSTVQFTGDTYATWPTLSFEVAFSTMEGNIGQPYVTDDIGSFHGDHLSDDMYVRWVQFGTFQPIFRLHSDHGDRLPPARQRRARDQPVETRIVVAVGEEIVEPGADQTLERRHARRLGGAEQRTQRVEDRLAGHRLGCAAQGAVELYRLCQRHGLRGRQAPENRLQLRGFIHAPARVEDGG